MSYNGIGLQTPRGSGTSGYVQKSLAKKKIQGFRRKREEDAEKEERREARLKRLRSRREGDAVIEEHDRKRAIELKCVELRDRLEDQDEEDEVIERKVAELRERLTKNGEREKNSEVKRLRDGGEEESENEEKEGEAEVGKGEFVEKKKTASAKDGSMNQTTNDKEKESPGASIKKDSKAASSKQTTSYNYVRRYEDR